LLKKALGLRLSAFDQPRVWMHTDLVVASCELEKMFPAESRKPKAESQSPRALEKISSRHFLPLQIPKMRL
jgi:hypothetical protein